MFKIRIYKKIPTTRGQTLIVELGRWWEIALTREFIESRFPMEKWTASKPPKGFVKLIKRGEIIPLWYGYAYHGFDRDVSAFMPIPLNLIRAAWEWLKWKVLRPVKIDLPRKLLSEQEKYLSEHGGR